MQMSLERRVKMDSLQSSAGYINLIVLQGVIRELSNAAKTDGTAVCTFCLDTGEAAVNAESGPLSISTNRVRCKLVDKDAEAARRELRNGQLYRCYGRIAQINYVNESTGRSGHRHEIQVFHGVVLSQPQNATAGKSDKDLIDEILFPPKDVA